jgi:hypothetical protein
MSVAAGAAGAFPTGAGDSVSTMAAGGGGRSGDEKPNRDGTGEGSVSTAGSSLDGG